MSQRNKHSPAVITVKPTVIRPDPPRRSNLDDWHSQFTRTVITAFAMATGVWLVCFAVSFYDATVSFWLGVSGLLATGIAIYRELCRAGLIPGRIVGLVLAIAPLAASCLFKLIAFPLIAPAYMAAVACGLLVGWAARTAGLIADAT